MGIQRWFLSKAYLSQKVMELSQAFEAAEKNTKEIYTHTASRSRPASVKSQWYKTP